MSIFLFNEIFRQHIVLFVRIYVKCVTVEHLKTDNPRNEQKCPFHMWSSATCKFARFVGKVCIIDLFLCTHVGESENAGIHWHQTSI